MNFILFIIAFLLVAILTPLGFFATLIKSILKFNNSILNDYFFSLALSLDQLGNVAMAKLFDFILIKKNSKNKFGNPDETISSVLGKNQKAETLAYFGKRLNALLNFLDKNHSIKSIEK
jgi:hypothetical protein